MIRHMNFSKKWILFILGISLFDTDTYKIKRFDENILKFLMFYFGFLPSSFVKKALGNFNIKDYEFDLVLNNFNQGLLSGEYYEIDNYDYMLKIYNAIPNSKSRSKFIEILGSRYKIKNCYILGECGFTGHNGVVTVWSNVVLYEYIFQDSNLPIVTNIWRDIPLTI